MSKEEGSLIDQSVSVQSGVTTPIKPMKQCVIIATHKKVDSIMLQNFVHSLKDQFSISIYTPQD